MESIRVAITHTEETIHPVHSLVCDEPPIDRELLLYFSVSDGRETTINYVEGDSEVYEEKIQTKLDIDEYVVYPDGDDGCYTYMRNDLGVYNRELATTLQRDTLAVIPPIEFRSDRRMILSLVTTISDFREISEEIPDGLTVDILSVGKVPQSTRSVPTTKQREAIETAWELGYYEIPRRANLEDVATELDVAVSTVSDLLRRGQAELVAAEIGASGR